MTTQLDDFAEQAILSPRTLEEYEEYLLNWQQAYPNAEQKPLDFENWIYQ